MSLFDFGFRLASPLLQRKDAEAAHLATIRALKCMPPLPNQASSPCWRKSCSGLIFQIRWGWLRGLTKTQTCQMPCCGWGLALLKLAR